MEHEIPNIIQEKDSKYRFDYKPDGLIYFGQEAVAVLDRKTGKTKIIAMAGVKKLLTPKHHSVLLSELVIVNNCITNKYHIIGLGGIHG